MMSGQIGRWYLLGLAGLALLLAALLAMLAVDRSMKNSALSAAQSEGAADAEILAAGLESELEKFSLVPRVLAVDPEVRALLESETKQQPDMNRRLEDLAIQTGATAIYLMDKTGETRSASNWQLASSFVGSNYGFRGYFKDAILSGSASEFALGTVSRRPGLYLAQRVGEQSNPIGVVAVKVEFDEIEESWRDAIEAAYVTDVDGVVLISSQPDWRFRTTDTDPTNRRSSAEDILRFGQDQLKPMPNNSSDSALSRTPMMEIAQPLSSNGWVLHLLVDPSDRIKAAVSNGRLIVLIGFIVAIAALGGLLFWIRRREMQAEVLMVQRTSMLRDQLQQANRLATLGQVTAGVGHEIRQPVAAVRLFAENGEKLLDKGKINAAGENFQKIVVLTAKIGEITEELLNFGRRPAHPPKEVPLSHAVDGALLLLRERIERQRVEIVLPDQALVQTAVRGEHVRLEQVLVNLLQNALDATGNGGKIAIEVLAQPVTCHLSVTDDGPGIDDDVAEKLFQPFATTKQSGIGLGLAISRDIMRALGGDLICEEVPKGARFIMVVPRA